MRFLTTDEVIEAHRLLTADDEDSPRVMDRGAVDSALDRAQWGPFEGQGDLAERAAFILRGIAQDHAFTNGNKRTAFTAAETFLQLNGMVIVATPDDVVAFMVKVAQPGMEMAEMAEWVRLHVANL